MTCVGGDGCSMPAASVLAIFCRFVGSAARGRLGETLEHGRDAQQPRHNAWRNPSSPAATLTQLLKVGKRERLARETSESFSFHERVFAGQVEHWIAKPASAASSYSRLLGRWDAAVGWAALTRSCYMAGVSTHLYDCF